MELHIQRTLIAEYCGWRDCIGTVGTETRYIGTPSECCVRVSLPDYLNDSNAMHQAVESLRNNQFHYVDYSRQLFLVVSGKEWGGDMGYFFFNYANATCRQKAEAFLRTISRWTE